ncbi:response regulator transcription factor [Aminipila terrae]|uniref:Stage 0 sporulation protein A homolog n=1 Tax=Aminipila terrae TaxID=2697030 RepID=A0A6P1MCL1_9FIRM|nr:response regulator transcription factor [Aminipila terrae]QHI71637.1 response regulator [Aminipila terrae]
MGTQRILIVDDDKNICKLMELYLGNAGYLTACCHDGSSALDKINKEDYNLVILDLMLPAINGWEVCRLIKMEKNIPIIMVTARDMIDDKINGFEAGADDYLVKPFEPKELVARVKARLKNAAPSDCKQINKSIMVDDLMVDINKYEVRINNQMINLKPKETQLLYFMLINKNIVFTREQLLEKIWDYSYQGDTRTVDVHIKCLREKLNSESKVWEIKTVWGVGYKLEVNE